MDLRNIIREFPDFPKPGVMFKDISPILKTPSAMEYVTERFCDFIKEKNVDLIAGAESRGLIFAATLALRARKGLVMVRKAGKLPGDTMPMAYDLEYGDAVMEVQYDAIHKGQRVLVVDDLLATGGTSRASGKLIEALNGIVAGYAFVIELAALKGRAFINHPNIISLVTYDD